MQEIGNFLERLGPVFGMALYALSILLAFAMIALSAKRLAEGN